jgi:hypothetical protein
MQETVTICRLNSTLCAISIVFASQFINHLGPKAAQIPRCAGGLIATQRTERSTDHSLLLLTAAALCAQTHSFSPVICTNSMSRHSLLAKAHSSPFVTSTNTCLSARYLHKQMPLR